jgi:hypothetical protein
MNSKGGRYMNKKRFIGAMLLLFVIGCAGESKQVQMKDMSANDSQSDKSTKTVEFPQGTVFGGASKEQATALAQIFVESHNMAMQQFGKIAETQQSIKEAQKAIKEGQDATKKSLEESNQKILGLAEKNMEAAQKALQSLEQLSQKQGTGEVTIFYNIGESKLSEKSLEYKRLVDFVDFLARESKGRKVLLISIGSASAVGRKSTNMRLAQARAEYPKPIIDKYLINIPHENFKVYALGDLYSPKNVSKHERDRYQHTRLLAVFDTDQIPALPADPAKK